MRLEGLGELKKKFKDFIGKRTHDFSACSIVPQPTTHPLSFPNSLQMYSADTAKAANSIPTALAGSVRSAITNSALRNPQK
jgi:hypothetical protein